MEHANKLHSSELSSAEIQVLEMIRNKRFLSIKLIIKNGEVDVIEGLERLQTGERIIDMLKQHDFQVCLRTHEIFHGSREEGLLA